MTAPYQPLNTPSKPQNTGASSGRNQKDRRYTDTFFDQHRFAGRFPMGRPWSGVREIAANRDGDFFWNETHVDAQTLLDRLKTVSVQTPQPEVHVRGDQSTRYEFIGRVITACERAGIAKVSFITEPPARGG